MLSCKSYVFALAAAMLAFGQANAAIVTINSNLVRAVVGEVGGPGGFTSYSGGTTIPLSHLVQTTGSNPLDEYAKVQLDYSASAGVTTFNHAFDLSREGALDNFSQTYDSTLKFTADSNTTYDVSGSMLVADIDGSSGKVFFHTSLFNVTTNTLVFEFENQSESTPNESFTLGTNGGELYNFQYGTLTGSLVAGNQYSWQTDTYIKATPDPDNGASATGFFKLIIGGNIASTEPVPEPSSILTLTGLALSFGAGNWWRRRKLQLAA